MLQLYTFFDCNTCLITTAKKFKEEHRTPRIVNFCRNKCIEDVEEGFRDKLVFLMKQLMLKRLYMAVARYDCNIVHYICFFVLFFFMLKIDLKLTMRYLKYRDKI